MEREIISEKFLLWSKNLEVLNDVIMLFKDFFENYDTRIYENRFLVGGFSEYVLCSYLDYLGENVEHVGSSKDGYDIILSNRFNISIKGYYVQNLSGKSIKSGRIKILNSLGDSTGRKWVYPTIFILCHTGFVLIFPGEIQTFSTRDSIEVKTKDILNFISKNPERNIKFNLPGKKKLKYSKTASYDITKHIFQNSNSRLNFS